jgi:hypothetical protein
MGAAQGFMTSVAGGAFCAAGPLTGGLGVLNEVGRAGAHAVMGGMFSEASGGNFWTGAATSFASSLVGSATAGAPVWAQIGVSTITGGVTSKVTGGTFWQGAVDGFMVSALNHAMDRLLQAIQNQPNLSLMFDGDQLYVVDITTGEIVYSTSATSGKGEHMNNPASQHISNEGPIPEGTYSYKNSNWGKISTIKQAGYLAMGLFGMEGGGDWGNYRVKLDVIKNNNSSRGNFYLHGGSFKGSAGCIDAGRNVGQIYNLTKSQPTTYLIIKY